MITKEQMRPLTEVARVFTERAAALKDYQCRSKRMREQRAAARSLAAGNGYVIKDNAVYGYLYSAGFKFVRPASINLVCIGKVGAGYEL